MLSGVNQSSAGAVVVFFFLLCRCRFLLWRRHVVVSLRWPRGRGVVHVSCSSTLRSSRNRAGIRSCWDRAEFVPFRAQIEPESCSCSGGGSPVIVGAGRRSRYPPSVDVGKRSAVQVKRGKEGEIKREIPNKLVTKRGISGLANMGIKRNRKNVYWKNGKMMGKMVGKK